MLLQLYIRYPFHKARALVDNTRSSEKDTSCLRALTSSEYSKKSPFDSHREHAVKACTTECPDECILTPPLSVDRIQHGRSPVKNTPEYILPGAGEVTKGISSLEIRFCSASTDRSASSLIGRMSKLRDRTLTNLSRRVEDLVDGTGTSGGSVEDAVS